MGVRKHPWREPLKPNRPTVTAEGDWAVVYVSVIVVSTVCLQRFALEIAGYPIQCSFIISALAVLWLVTRRAAYIDSARLALYLLVVTILSGTTILNAGQSSITSLGLLLVIYSSYVVVMPVSAGSYLRILNVYQRTMLLVALAGLLQFSLQFVWPFPGLFSFEGLVPQHMLMPGFNTVIPLAYGSTMFKSNGFVLLEPSTFSQLLALAALIELLFFPPRVRLLAYLAGMVVSYSGTGVLLLMLLGPLAFLLKRRIGFLLAFLGIGSIALAMGELLSISIFVSRADEFSSTSSSGYARFIGPFHLVGQYIFDDFWAFLLGKGAGTIESYIALADRPSHDPSWAKLIFEYGLSGAIAFIVFLFMCMFGTTHSRILSAAFWLKFFFLGGVLLSQTGSMLALALIALPKCHGGAATGQVEANGEQGLTRVRGESRREAGLRAGCSAG